MKWYHLPLLVAAIPISLYVAARDLWDGWYYRP